MPEQSFYTRRLISGIDERRCGREVGDVLRSSFTREIKKNGRAANFVEEKVLVWQVCFG